MAEVAPEDQQREVWQDLRDAHERGRADVAEWIAYADKLEAALKLAAGQRSDILMRMHAEQGLRIVRPTIASG